MTNNLSLPINERLARIPSRWKRNDPLRARKLSETTDAVRKIISGTNAPRQFVRSRQGTGATTQTTTKQFKITSIEDDHLVCNPFNGIQSESESIKVAKSYLLRKSPFDGSSRDGVSFTYTTSVLRIATKDSDTETQVVVPSYVVGDVIYATSNISGGTGVTLNQGTETEEAIIWLDDNRDGRAWAKQAS